MCIRDRRYTADVGKSLQGEAIFGDSFPGGSRDKMSCVTRVPVGTVLAISPFNYPVNLAISKIGPALMGGNTVIFKPATQGAVSALMMVEALQQAGLPAGVLNTVTGLGSVIGDYVVSHKDVDFINFTGSTEVGKHISSLTSMTPVIMEPVSYTHLDVYKRQISGISREEFLQARDTILSEPNVDRVFEETLPVDEGDRVFAMEYLPGQYDQRADSAAQCVQLLTQGERPQVLTARVVALKGSISDEEFTRIQHYLVNPVESRIASLELSLIHI